MKTDIGKIAEAKAVSYLQRKNFHILCRNYRCKFGEIDIIAKSGETTVFAEVKSRSVNSLGLPCEAVDKRKQFKIRKTAGYYICEKKVCNQNFRFDVVELIKKENKWYIRHIENAFM